MRCASCGHRSAYASEFCDNCGAPLISAQPEHPRVSRGLTLFTGLILIFAGVALMVTGYLDGVLYQFATTLLARYGQEPLAEFGAIRGLCNLFFTPFYVPGQYFPLVAGIAMLLRRPGAAKAAIAASVALLLFAVSSIAAQIFFWIFPTLSFPESSSLLLSLTNPFVWWYLAVGILAFLLGVVALVCTIVTLKKGRGRLLARLPRGVFALLVAVPFYFCLNFTVSFLYTLTIDFFSTSLIAARYLFHSYFTTIPILPGILCVGLCMLLWKKPFVLSTLPLSLLAILGNAASLVIAYIRLSAGGVPAETIDIVRSGLPWIAIGTCAWQIGMVFWISASARGNLPLWIQIPLGFVLPVAYVLPELLKLFMHLPFYLPFGQVAVALLLVAVSTVCVFAVKSDARRENLRT